MWFKPKRHPLEALASDKANIIQHQLTRLNLAYRTKYKGQERVQRVEFVEPLIATPAEVRVEVDVNRLPRSVTISDLKKPDVVETLTVACRHTVKAEYKKGKGGGFWFVVELEERYAVPKVVKFSDMQRPADAAPLTFPVGVGTKGLGKTCATFHTSSLRAQPSRVKASWSMRSSTRWPGDSAPSDSSCTCVI